MSKYIIIKVSEEEYKHLKAEKDKLHISWYNLFVQPVLQNNIKFVPEDKNGEEKS